MILDGFCYKYSCKGVFWDCFGGQNGISPGQLSHCVMDLLQYKNKKGSYTSLQSQEARSWLALEEERNMLQQEEKLGKQSTVGSQTKNEAKKRQGIGLL